MAARPALKLPYLLKNPSIPISVNCCARTRPLIRRQVFGAAPRRTASKTFATTTALQEKKYTKDHEWVDLSEDGTIGTIGITSYAAKALGDVVFVELPEKGLEVNAEDSIGAVESVKSAADINTPVSGTITEVNDVLQEKPGTINKGPETDGWIAKIKVSDQTELEGLMEQDAYEDFIKE